MRASLPHITLRQRAAGYFAVGFSALWSLCMIVLYFQFENALLDSFDEEMRMRASAVVGQTSVNPRIVPLPQQNENFIILYDNTYFTDTIFAPSGDLNRILSHRNVRVEEAVDEGTLIVLYTIPSTKVDNEIHRIFVFMVFFLLAGIILSVLFGYYLSGKIIKPVNQVINLANEVDILNKTLLLREPEYNDELKQLIVSFNRMLLRIREQTERRNAFFASASHELRTPLSIMQTRIQVLLRDESVNDETKKACAEQLKEVKRLSKMVNDFLLVSELQDGNMQIVKQKCQLPEIIGNIVSHNKTKTQERDLKFKISFIPEDECFCVAADIDKLQIILNNLINNSVKYAEESSVIEIEVEMKKENISVLSIKNKIRKDIYPETIDPQKQFYHSKPLHGEGSGLGLWISSQLAMILGFELSVDIHGKRLFEVKLVMKGSVDYGS